MFFNHGGGVGETGFGRVWWEGGGWVGGDAGEGDGVVERGGQGYGE